MDLTSEIREFNDTELTLEPVSPNVLCPNVGHSSADGFGVAQNADDGESVDVNEVAPSVDNSGQGGVPVQSDGDDAGEADENFDDEEAPKIVVQKIPKGPTAEEYRAHQATHVLFRSRCPKWVAGRSHNAPI